MVVVVVVGGFFLYSFIYLFYMEKDVHTYTLVVNLGYMTFSIDNPQWGCNNPPSESMFGKKPSGEQALRV